jgi:hypothetical protein
MRIGGKEVKMYKVKYDKDSIGYRHLVADKDGRIYCSCTAKRIAQHVRDVLNARLAQEQPK